MTDIPLIQTTDLSKTYGKGELAVHALRGVDLSIDVGEFVAVMGPSGSGKSTLMNLLGCLDRPTTGSLELLGHEVGSFSPAELADVRNRVLGFVFQNFSLLPRTSALENVQLPLIYAGFKARERKQMAAEALAKVGLADRMTHHPSELSGGQQQRVAIARALVSNPRIILADEPTGNLDTKTSLEVIALFQELGDAGITIIYVTHEPEISSFASRVLTIRDGRLAEDLRQEPARAA
jgi:putative ABC transport system ATP-binding protein